MFIFCYYYYYVIVKFIRIIYKKKSQSYYCPKLGEKFPILLITQYKTVKTCMYYIVILENNIAIKT